MEKIIVLASHNKGKVKEFQTILGPYGYTVKSVADFNHHEEPEENGKTYSENAYIKAKYYFDVLHMPVIADDSGIEIEALGEHFPGIRSARYRDEIKQQFNDDEKSVNHHVIEKIKGNKNRKASFHCCICLIDEKGKEHFFEGICPGIILDEVTGDHGFGYDSLFKSDEKGLSFGLASEDEKNEVSHRGKAVNNLIKYLSQK